MGNAILKKFEDIKETMNCCSTNKTENIKDDEKEITLGNFIYKKGEENEYEIIEKIKEKYNDENNEINESVISEDENLEKKVEITDNNITQEFISLSSMSKEEDTKFNLDIMWIDQNIFNSENQSYLENMKINYPNIKIKPFDNLNEGFKAILELEFISIFVIVSGRLYSQYYHKLKNNLDKIKCLPINIIFTSVKFKKILENEEPDTEQIISYDIQKSINNSFYNSGGVFDSYNEISNYLNKFNSNFSKKILKGNLFNLSYEGLFTFNYLNTESEFLAPILYKDIITKKKISYDEINEFNKYLLTIGNPDINYLIEPLSLLKYVPIEIICKYWTRVYTISSDFYKEINNKLMKSEIKLYDIYIRTLYYGLESNSLFSDMNHKLYRGSIINENEINKIINNKNKKIIVFCKAFLSFSKELDVAVNFLKTNNLKEGNSYVFFELNAVDKNETDNYNKSNIIVEDLSVYKTENEILFLPGSSFEIKEIKKNVNINGIDTCKIILAYIGKFNKDFYEIYNNPKKIYEFTKNNEIIEPIMEYFFSDKDLFCFDNNDIEYFNNGKYILSKIIKNIDPYYWYYKNDSNHDNNSIKTLLRKTIFPMYLLKNRFNNNYYIANLFYKINTEKETFYSNIDFIKNIENPFSLKCIDNFEDKDFYYVIYEYYDETLEDFINKYKQKNNSMPVNFIHKILTQLNKCFEKMVKIDKYHKDIKPGNIYIVYTDYEKNNFDIRLGGFNLSIDEEKSNHGTSCEGNDYFKAPESFFKGNHKKCDLWSIGILIYYLSFLKPLKNLENFRKPKDEDLKDLITKLVVIPSDERMNWEQYFSHPFFKKYQ